MKGTFFETFLFMLGAGAMLALLLTLQLEIPLILILMLAAWSICIIMGNSYIRLCAGIVGIAVLGVSAFLSFSGDTLTPGYRQLDRWERRKRSAEWVHAHSNELAISAAGIIVLAVAVGMTAQRIKHQEFTETLENSRPKTARTKWSVFVRKIR